DARTRSTIVRSTRSSTCIRDACAGDVYPTTAAALHTKSACAAMPRSPRASRPPAVYGTFAAGTTARAPRRSAWSSSITPVRAPGCEIGFVRPQVGTGQETARRDERADLLAVTRHGRRSAGGIRSDESLGAADGAAEHGELVGHRASEKRALPLRHVRGQARP